MDDLMAAPLVGANRHALECDERSDKWAAYEMFGEMRGSTQDEVDALNRMLASMSIPLQVTVDDVMGMAERMERQIELEYDEYVVATPKHLTSEDLTANHAAGLPLTREHIVRCKDCYYFFRNATPHDDECPHFCSKHGIDMGEDDNFCSWGRPREDE